MRNFNIEVQQNNWCAPPNNPVNRTAEQPPFGFLWPLARRPVTFIVRVLSMRATARILFLLANCGMAISVCAAEVDFTGVWSLDLRSKAERKRGVECGNASFSLSQLGNKISGDHAFSTPSCGRLNEGGEGTVKGVVVGNTAVLVVTSGRNGAVVMGTAKKNGNFLHWNTVEEIRPGEPEGDSPLILSNGILTLEKPHAK